MKRLSIFCVFVTLYFCNADEVPLEKVAKESAAKLSKEEIYNINADIYCQTEYAIEKNIWKIENPINIYKKILEDDVTDIDCEAVRKEYTKRMFQRLRQDLKSKGAKDNDLDCYMKAIETFEYDKLRFKFNALYGIEMDQELKDKLRKQVDKQIAVVVEVAVEKCFEESKSGKDNEAL
jgi:hypothetical protein